MFSMPIIWSSSCLGSSSSSMSSAEVLFFLLVYSFRAPQIKHSAQTNLVSFRNETLVLHKKLCFTHSQFSLVTRSISFTRHNQDVFCFITKKDPPKKKRIKLPNKRSLLSKVASTRTFERPSCINFVCFWFPTCLCAGAFFIS